MVDAISEPGREDALIGSLVLETLDFLVDPLKERLIPRDPRRDRAARLIV